MFIFMYKYPKMKKIFTRKIATYKIIKYSYENKGSSKYIPSFCNKYKPIKLININVY